MLRSEKFDDDDDDNDNNNNNNNNNSVNGKVQNIFHGRNNITCSTDCQHRIVTTLYTPETLFVSSILL
jgi:hypothetical protein